MGLQPSRARTVVHAEKAEPPGTGRRTGGSQAHEGRRPVPLRVGIFFGVIGVVYWFWGYEDGGFLMLLAPMGLGLLPGSYYLWWSHRMKPGPRTSRGRIEEGEGTVDAFPSSSIWPFLLGMGAFMAAL